MMAALSFNLNEPDEREAHMRAVKSLDLALALLRIQEILRKHEKYEDKPLDGDQFCEILADLDINLDNLIS